MKINRPDKFILFFVVPILLMFFWVSSSLLFNKEISFSVVTYNHSDIDSKISSSDKLFKGKKATGEFRAKDNYLGIVILGFNNFVKPDFRGEDVLVFRLKEKSQNVWHYEQAYRSGALERNLKFPFGFPIIEKSKNKEYQFEIESLYGNERNAVEVNTDVSISSAYQFPKEIMQASRRNLLEFTFKKIYLSFTNVDFLLSSTLYLFPLLLYLSAFIIFRKFVIAKKIFGSLVFLLLLIDVLLIKETHLGILLSIILGMLIMIKVSKLKSSHSFMIAFGGIVFWGLLLLFRITDIQNKLNIWTYFFLVAGLIQAVLEERKASLNE